MKSFRWFLVNRVFYYLKIKNRILTVFSTMLLIYYGKKGCFDY